MKPLQPRPQFTKIVVILESRPDGGLRAYSDDAPGFVLSNPDRSAVMADIQPALEVILSAMWGVPVIAEPLGSIERDDEQEDALQRDSSADGIIHPLVRFELRLAGASGG